MATNSLTAPSLQTAHDINDNRAGLTADRISVLRQEFEKGHGSGFVDDHDRVLRGLRPAIERLEAVATLDQNVKKELTQLREAMSLRLYTSEVAPGSTLIRPGQFGHEAERGVRRAVNAGTNFVSDRPVTSAVVGGLGLFGIYKLFSMLRGNSSEEAAERAAAARERSGGSFFKWALFGLAGAVGLGYLVNRAGAAGPAGGPGSGPALPPTAEKRFADLLATKPNGLTFAELDDFLRTEAAGTTRDLLQVPINIDGKKVNFDADKNLVIDGKKYRVRSMGLEMNNSLVSALVQGNSPLIAVSGTMLGVTSTAFIRRDALTTIVRQVLDTPPNLVANIEKLTEVPAATPAAADIETINGKVYRKSSVQITLVERP